MLSDHVKEDCPRQIPAQPDIKTFLSLFSRRHLQYEGHSQAIERQRYIAFDDLQKLRAPRSIDYNAIQGLANGIASFQLRSGSIKRNLIGGHVVESCHPAAI